MVAEGNVVIKSIERNDQLPNKLCYLIIIDVIFLLILVR